MQNVMSSPRKKLGSLLASNAIVIAFIVLCAALYLANPNFLDPINIRNVLRQTSINAILAIGMTFVILTGGIDLSVGSILAFGGMIASILVSSSLGEVYPVVIAVPIGLLAGLALGAVNGFFTGYLRVPSFVVTLGMLSAARGLTLIASDGRPVSRLAAEYLFIGQGAILSIPIPILIMFGTYAVAWFVLYRTTFGRYVYAVGGNEEAAKISGVRVRLIKFSVFCISGLLSALGGIILSARTTAGLPQAGETYELDAIAAVVIGGTSLFGGRGTLFGSLIGALIIGVVNNGLDLLGVSAYFQLIFKGAIIVAAVLLDSLRRR